MNAEIMWTCTDCGEPITDLPHGSVVLPNSMEYQAGVRAWEAKRDVWRGSLTADEIHELPKRLQIRVVHDECYLPTEAEYWWALDRCATAWDLLHRIGHLAGKRWWDFYAWGDFLREVAADRGSVVER